MSHSIQSEIDELESDLEFTQTREEIEGYVRRVELLKNNETNSRIQELRNKIKEMQSEIQTLKSQKKNKETKKQIRAFSHLIDALRTKDFVLKEEKLKKLQDKLNTSKENLDGMEELKNVENEVDSETAPATEKAALIENLKQKLKKLYKQKHNRKIKNIRVKIEEMKNDESKAEQVGRLEEEMKDLRKETQQTQRKIKNIRRKIKVLITANVENLPTDPLP